MILSVWLKKKYIYTGGARGTTVHIPVNIDVSGEKEVKLADLFADDGYVSTLNRMINEEMEKHSEEYKDLWAKPEIKTGTSDGFFIFKMMIWLYSFNRMICHTMLVDSWNLDLIWKICPGI